ncbi:hypothetical protein GCM10010329_17990 [Streptomyces spiroverticillatus]|uniref:Uncharacterized protein n=1 Tax=Streptomyces finlayi TaxID=67296 RepID=A0A918WTV5_9ACTN|nr:hypothetical protein [Streptomyces finlayi]GGZ97113.1 hypothetical protein GCM10010329_17990 [Streptomyces spiroverticillatus]GHC82326.1 hypothetical protein GCM10010334_10470 [Streptomyces finlayi]
MNPWILLEGLELLAQTRYGALGAICLLLIVGGAKARNATCTALGATLFAILMLQA